MDGDTEIREKVINHEVGFKVYIDNTGNYKMLWEV